MAPSYRRDTGFGSLRTAGAVQAQICDLAGVGAQGKKPLSGPNLRTWARHIAEWRRERRTVFVYFDNDQKSAAPTDARRLVEILQRTGRK